MMLQSAPGRTRGRTQRRLAGLVLSVCRDGMSRDTPRIVRRPSKLTPEVTERLLHALRTGNARVMACRYAGISEPTFHRWMTDERPEFRKFREVVEQAEATAEVGVVANLVELSKRDHRAAVAWLERKAPERWRLDEPADAANELYPQGAIAQEPDDAQGPSRQHERSTLLPPALFGHFVEAVRHAQETGEMPAWVGRHEQERDDEWAVFHESAE